jgi:NAD(P)-dependent dehydrogenase (short-subunit alcohol dehydrogenase family)
MLFHSHDTYFRQRLPWRLGLVRLDAGPVVVAHVHRSVASAPTVVRVEVRLDRAGQAALIARLPGEDTAMNDDQHIREMSCDPRGLNVLVTDGTTAVGQSLIRGFLDAGAQQLWAGEPPGTTCKPPEIERSELLSVVPLDVRSADSVRHAAETFGSNVDILVNNSRHDGGTSSDGAPPDEAAREEMEVNYFGLLHLSRHFAPLMQARAASGTAAWVNLLTVYALCNLPSQPTFSASMAAALSLSQGLRARMQPTGLRMVNVFAGPIAPDDLSRSVVAALRDGVEDVYPGEVAQEWLARWLESPKVLERELAANIYRAEENR